MSLRLRVTLAFTLMMAIVLGALGAFVYLRERDSLNESIDNGLRARATVVTTGPAGPRLIESDETVTQVLTPSGRVLAGPPAPLLDVGGLSEPAFRTVAHVDSLEDEVRLFAAPRGTDVVIVGASLGDRNEALANLAGVLLIGGPLGLALAALAGSWAIGRALRPMDAMRRRAAELSPGDRLPVPETDDELRRLGLTLNAMLDRLDAALARERRFVDDASHELRTPLALQKTELEIALRQGRTVQDLRAAIVSAAEEVDRLIGLAEALLVVARAGEGALELRLEPVTAATLLEDVSARFETRAAQGGRVIDAAADDDLVVQADRVLLGQALTSLVDNAFRHGSGTVTVSATAAGITVTDEGLGFPPEFAARAFDRFSRADAARGGEGFGLGLAIVDAIVRAHGGSATASGAAVRLALPFTVVSPAPAYNHPVPDPKGAR